jgi:glycosyltransferase involved in cell wall biosynthesis
MRIALVHSYYSAAQPSGENVVVDAQAAALRRAGHDLLIVSRRSDDAIGSSKLATVVAGLAVASGRGADPSAELRAFRPDVIHVHNLFPNWGRRWLKNWPTPVVATLHNFRPYCSAGTLYREGRPCTECLDDGTHRAVVNRCYRDSAAATIPLAIATRGGARTDEVIARADALITLSARAASMHEAAGVDGARLRIVPNFVRDPKTSPDGVSGDRWAVIGRLTKEKGVHELLREWPQQVGLDVVGGGPLQRELESIAPSSVRFHGTVSQESIPVILDRARGFVFPSRAAEGGVPLSYVEALAAARPVIALAGNGAADDVTESGAGLVLSSWAALPAAIRSINENWPMFSSAARKHYDERYSEARWLASMTSVYEDVIARSTSGAAASV